MTPARWSAEVGDETSARLTAIADLLVPAYDEMSRAADVLLIGAGASGSVVTKRLAEAGIAVTCLEQGGWVSADSFLAGSASGTCCRARAGR